MHLVLLTRHRLREGGQQVVNEGRTQEGVCAEMRKNRAVLTNCEMEISLAQTSRERHKVEPLYCGHLGDPVKCPVYSGTSLLWTPWGPAKVSCIERCPHFRGKFILQKDIAKCLKYRGVLISGVSFKRGSTVSLSAAA